MYTFYIILCSLYNYAGLQYDRTIISMAEHSAIGTNSCTGAKSHSMCYNRY